ncbi:MAG: MFS transporter [Terracidiphilus sp.]
MGGFAAMLLATYAATNPRLFPEFGWRRAFWAPALPLLFIALAFVQFVRNRPADVGLPPVKEDHPIEAAEGGEAPLPGEHEPLTSEVVARVLSDKSLWLLSASYFFIKLTRYAFLFWLPAYMAEGLHYSVAAAGYLSSLYELVGFTGVIIAGYASDKLFQSRRFPVGAIMLWGLSIACLLQPTLAAQGYKGNALGVSLIGIMTFGPDSLISGAAAQDVGSQQGAATAAGIIDGVGSFGQIISPFVVVFVSQRYSWNALFYLFVVLTLIAGSLQAIGWNYRAHPGMQEAGC